MSSYKSFLFRVGSVAALFFLFVGCKSVKETIEVPVYLHDTTRETHTEFVHITDTVVNNIETIIREANAGDSILLSQLGIQLKDNEHTILVLRNELLEKSHLFEQSQSDSSHHSIDTPVPIKETKYVEVEKTLKWWQKTLMWFGIGFLAVIIGTFLFMWLSLRDRV